MSGGSSEVKKRGWHYFHGMNWKLPLLASFSLVWGGSSLRVMLTLCAAPSHTGWEFGVALSRARIGLSPCGSLLHQGRAESPSLEGF